ncbi:MAG TPA: hypothetical protein VFF14_07855 [Candidatus Deferrimicrobium sp.]|nr:hypothetical protein [Candidatus Deferrimicrobium sp.]
MKLKKLAILLIPLLFLSVLVSFDSGAKGEEKTPTDLYFGVDVAFESLGETLRIVDEVSSYTNLFVIGCYGPVAQSNHSRPIYNETRLSSISEYVYQKGLSFIVYSDDPRFPSAAWLTNARADFGDKFLGIYYYDEPGGRQLDQANYPAFYYAKNFSDAANRYVNTVNWWLRSGPFSIARNFGDQANLQLFTSDYGLYWYDYQAGYDTVFAEYGWNSGWEDYSRQLNTALVRGAATALNKDWGIMITWAYQQPPYMESGPNLYQDMVSAYQNGAKYIIVFDSNKDWTGNVLQKEHFEAMKQFWQYAKTNPRIPMPTASRSAFVLPESYGEGFRNPDDTIWGLWRADFNVAEGSQNFTTNLRMTIATLLQMSGPKLDLIYPRASQTTEQIGYENVLYWNDSGLIPNGQSIPSQRPAGNESAWQLQTPTPTPSPVGSQYSIGFYLLGVGAMISVTIFVSVRTLSEKRKRGWR